MTDATLPTRASASLTREDVKVIVASSLGTVFEWYDFILFGSLASVMAQQFFAKAAPTTAFILALSTFSAGFIVRPLGGVIFGKLGDALGRKYTFLTTIVIMGVATFSIGLLPNAETIGIAAPVIFLLLRLLQGLAVGGEYGGAVIYVAEHAPPEKRGAFTSWIQTTGTCGFILSLIVVLVTRTIMGEPAFLDWGWRLPFLLSSVLLAISIWIRLSLDESPVFARMRAEGTLAKAPLRETFGSWPNIRLGVAALLGLVAGFSTLWYTTQFYLLVFLTQTLKVDGPTANLLVVATLLLGTPFFVIFGALSDRIGRKTIIVSGILLTALALYPGFRALTHFANPALERALATSPVALAADPADCHFQFDITGTTKFLSSCDIAKAKLAAAGVEYRMQPAEPGSVATVHVGETSIASFDGKGLEAAAAKAKAKDFAGALGKAVQAAGYPAKADPAAINRPMVVLVALGLLVLLTMAYGPAAAALAEMFPARIRYSSVSVVYHLGSGWFGGITPTLAVAMTAATGNIYAGLEFPVVVGLASAVIGFFFVRETRHRDITA